MERPRKPAASPHALQWYNVGFTRERSESGASCVMSLSIHCFYIVYAVERSIQMTAGQKFLVVIL